MLLAVLISFASNAQAEFVLLQSDWLVASAIIRQALRQQLKYAMQIISLDITYCAIA